MATNTNPMLAPKIIFWALWILLLPLIPFYLFTTWFEFSVIESDKITTILSGVIGSIVSLSQLFITSKSASMIRQYSLDNKQAMQHAFLYLIGGSLILIPLWIGGCAMMGNWYLG